MDAKMIAELIGKDQSRTRKIAEQRQYAGGRNSAILGRKPHEEPDNRIPIPIARKGIRLVSGYMFKPGNITYSDDAQYVDDTLKPILDENDEELTTQEEAETVLTHGEAWELCYLIDGQVNFAEVPVEQCIPIWSDELKPTLLGMIRYYKLGNRTDEICEAIYYDAQQVTRYQGKTFGDLALSEAMPGDANPRPHPFGEVPFVQFKMAKDLSNLFDAVIPLIDIHDRVISEDYGNEAQRFANSYLLLRDRLSTELDEIGLNEIDKIRITRTFEGLGDDVTKAVAFLEKNIPIDFVKNAADTFERLIYDMMQIINPNDMATTGQVSGIALAYKLLQFEYLCASIEAYFSRGLQWRLRLINKGINGLKANPADEPQVTIHFRRNLPFDMATAVDMFVKIAGLLPDDIALKLFPADFISNVQKTAEEMAKMRPSMTLDTTPSGAPQQSGAQTPIDNVQQTALNGAQVQALIQLAEAVQAKQIPADSAVQILMVALPTITQEQATKMLASMNGGGNG